MHCELLIRGGTIADGTGAGLYEGDVAIAGGRIVAMGAQPAAQGDVEIDARGHLVTPGFVDIHTHYDGQVTWEQRLSPSSEHGVTTVLMGNCGVGFAPCRPQDRARLIQLMEGVEDLPEVVLAQGLPWSWESFPDYLDVLQKRTFDVDVATQVPHAALRVFAMGERASERERATSEDRALMARLAREAVGAGALGFGTSRTLNHRASDGSLIPTLNAAEEELTEIGQALGSIGRGVLQLVSDFTNLPEEIALLRRVVERSGRPLSLSLLQTNHEPDKWRAVMGWVERCNADGLEVRAQVSGRPTGLLLGFDLTRNPFYMTPTFRRLKTLPVNERRRALRQPETRSRLLSEVPGRDDSPGAELARYWAGMYPMGERPNYEPSPDSNIAAEAARRGVSPEELAYDVLLDQDAQGVLMVPVANFTNGSLDAAGEMLRHPNSIYGLGDGGAHLGFLCDASLPTFMLQYWARERKTGRIPVAEVVRGLSHDTARAVGLGDRGLLRPGYRADINIIDFDNLRLGPPRVRNDLPAGGARLTQSACGYVVTIVAGTVTYKNGLATGALPGRLVRGPQVPAFGDRCNG